jgi:hypothetical protein
MKTTIEIPDAIFRRAKVLAAERGIPFRALISEALSDKERLLLSDRAVLAFPAALKEAMAHHALSKQKKDDHQDSYKQELPNSEKGWLSSGRGRLIHLPFLLLSKLSPIPDLAVRITHPV